MVAVLNQSTYPSTVLIRSRTEWQAHRGLVQSRRPSPIVIRRRRTVAVGILVLALCGLWIALQAALGGAGGGPLTTAGIPGGSTAPIASHAWVVAPGDTLWSIAERLHPGADVRPLVDRMEVVTARRPIHVGERILLP